MIINCFLQQVAILCPNGYNVIIEAEVRCMTERMTGKEIQEKYPVECGGGNGVKQVVIVKKGAYKFDI